MLRKDVPEVLSAQRGDALTVREVGGVLQASHDIVYELIHSKRLPAFKVGRRWRVHRQDLAKYMENGKHQP